MVSITVVVQYSDGNNERLKLTVSDRMKVWQLSSFLEWMLNTGISAEIATKEKVLVGDIRLQPVVGGETYILVALEKSQERASGTIAATS